MRATVAYADLTRRNRNNPREIRGDRGANMMTVRRYGSVVFVLLFRIQRTCTVLGDHGGEDISLWEALSIVAVVGGQHRRERFPFTMSIMLLGKPNVGKPAMASALHQIGRIRVVGDSVAILAFLVHPCLCRRQFITRWFWAFSVYLESVSVLPQLRVMQNAKMVETFTGHYIFALGVARFSGCAHWIIHVSVGSGSIKASGGVESSSIKASGGFEVRLDLELLSVVIGIVLICYFLFYLDFAAQLIEGSGDARVMDCKTHWHKGKLKKALVNPHA
ncbi:hypothetical protein Sjap_002571 [Stephania japonica]|uniref:Uncharacterized protein n=1 Tax=Stephania japonica TaxID=461633 RepID=A0AAP0KM39_9MAGN